MENLLPSLESDRVALIVQKVRLVMARVDVKINESGMRDLERAVQTRMTRVVEQAESELPPEATEEDRVEAIAAALEGIGVAVDRQAVRSLVAEAVGGEAE